MSTKPPKLWLVYLAQAGNNLRVNMKDADVQAMQGHIYAGRPFGVWFTTDAGRLTGLTVNPVFGGLTVSIEPPMRIPVDAHGNPAETQQSVARFIEPHEQPIADLHLPGWANQPNGDGSHVDEAPPITPEPPTPAPEAVEQGKPPGPGGAGAGTSDADAA